MPDKDKDHQRFTEHLPFYVNGTLSQDDHQWMASYLASHPEARNEQRFVELLGDLSRHTSSPVPESERLERFMGKWREVRPTPSFLQKVKDLLRLPLRIPATALAAVTVVVIAQSVIIGSLVTESGQEETFRGERGDCVVGPRIRVVFIPEARHVEIVLLLRKLEMTVQEGPSETGEFWLAAPKGRSLEEAQAMLRSSAVVEEAVVARDNRPTAGCAK